jgi:hypothetical protein
LSDPDADLAVSGGPDALARHRIAGAAEIATVPVLSGFFPKTERGQETERGNGTSEMLSTFGRSIAV